MRQIRLLRKDAIYHITARINKQEMILQDSSIKDLFLGVVEQAKTKYSFELSDFTIMDNHIHCVIKPFDPLPKIMQWILSVFAIRYNKMFNLKGHVWYDRYKSVIIETIVQFVNTVLYIANNPIRAKIIKHPLKWAYCGLATRYHDGKWKKILDPLPTYMNDVVNNYLRTFKKEIKKHSQIWEGYTFKDKKPGRPKQ